MALGTYPPITLAVNKFIGTLTNLIGYAQVADTLERGELDRFVSSCQDVNVTHGDGKVVMSVNVMNVTDLPTNSTLLTSVPPDIREQYIPVDAFKTIQTTVNKYLMRGAFTDEYAAANLYAFIREAMESTKRIWMYNVLVGKYNAYDPEQASQTVTVDLIDITGITEPTEIKAAKTLNTNTMYERLIQVLTEMGADTTAYNDLGLTEVIDYKSLKFVANSYFNGQMIVNTLATLLNSDLITEAQKWSSTYVIPQGKFTEANKNTVIGWLGHNKKIQFGYFYNVATSFFDASTLNQSDWLHFSYYCDEVDALPMVVFKANYVALGGGAAAQAAKAK